MGRKGMRRRAPHQADVARNVIWQSMRKLRRFTRADLIAVAEAKRDNVNRYCAALREHGYLRVVQEKQQGIVGGDEVLLLIKNSGPVAPRVTEDGIFDGNLADPYLVSPSKRLAKHAPAMMLALRRIVDASNAADAQRLIQAIGEGRDVLDRHDGAVS